VASLVVLLEVLELLLLFQEQLLLLYVRELLLELQLARQELLRR